MTNILLIGSGGREHALAKAILKSPLLNTLHVLPGNAATEDYNASINVESSREVIGFCVAHEIDLVVVGPEAPLVSGLADDLRAAKIKVFGPGAKAAQLEGSKTFTRQFCSEHGIAGPRFASFDNVDAAISYVEKIGVPVVVKADGLAAGKGVVIPENLEKTRYAIRAMLEPDTDGYPNHDRIVIEERMEGEEVSLLGFCDGSTAVGMPLAQDHKRVGEGDTGLNTGGMGAFAPVPGYDSVTHAGLTEEFLQRCVDAMAKVDAPYVGMLYAGLMMTAHGPRLVEYNCRFGDPEAQVLLELLEHDIVEIMLACVNGRLDEIVVEYKSGVAGCVVIAASGYPEVPKRGIALTIPTQSELDALSPEGVELSVIHAGTARRGKSTVSSGGRVLNVVAHAKNLDTAFEAIQPVVDQIVTASDGNLFARSDIGARHRKVFNPEPTREPLTVTIPTADPNAEPMVMPFGSSDETAGDTSTVSETEAAYAAAGVSLSAGAETTDRIKTSVKATHDDRVVSSLGSFGGVFDIAALTEMNEPLLVATTDGVGTKTMIAEAMDKWEGCGADIVNHGVNDVLVQGAKPLFFLDTVASEKLDPEVVGRIVDGMATACKENDCVLLGGETAEMPGVLCEGAVDIAGTLVGAVERSKLLPREGISAGYKLVGLQSSGLHTNGYSLARKIAAEYDYRDELPGGDGTSIGDALLAVHRSYLKPLEKALDADLIEGLAHITGGGFLGNIPRILPDGCGAEINWGSWPIPAVFAWLIDKADLSAAAASNILNCGIGMVCVVKPENVAPLQETLDEQSWVIGEITEGRQVEIITSA